MMRTMTLAVLAAVLLGCSATPAPQETQKAEDVATPRGDPRTECQRHCMLNYQACHATANSPDAEQECWDTFNACTSSC